MQGRAATNSAGSRFVHRVYTVFNASQIEGVPAYEPKRPTPFEVIEAGDTILATRARSCITINRIGLSTRGLPIRFTFPSARPSMEHRAITAPPLHELAHWTGHPDRLNRQTLNESYRFGDQNYAREELRAELASVFLAAERGIPHDPYQTRCLCRFLDQGTSR